MRFFLLSAFCFVCIVATAQYEVRFIVRDLAEIKRDSIFISGTFNNWDSLANKNYKLDDYGDGQKGITLSLPAGDIRYKYTGGNWFTVEKTWGGDEVGDRLLTINGNTEVKDTVLEWRDLFLKDKWRALSKNPNDTVRLRLQAYLGAFYGFNSEHLNVDSAFAYVQKALQTLDKIRSSGDLHSWPGYNSWLANTLGISAGVLHTLGNYPRSLELRLEILKLTEQEKDLFAVVNSMIDITDDYLAMKDYSNALEYCRKARSVLSKANVDDLRYGKADTWIDYHAVSSFSGLSLPDSAFAHAKNMYKSGQKNNVAFTEATACKLFGDYFSLKGPSDSALYYYRRAVPLAYRIYLVQIGILSQTGLARLFQKMGQTDSALAYANAALRSVEQNKTQLQSWTENPNTYIAEISPLIAELYQSRHQLDSAYKYLQLSVATKDSLYNLDKIRQFQNLTFNESVREQEEKQKEKDAREKYQTRLKFYGLAFGIAGLLLLAILLYRNNKQKQRANAVLADQKGKVEKTLDELQRTQKQLIQSEKMASLGELTAGIAHEILNPLNFVNNFSEVNKELIEEVKSEKIKDKSERNDGLEMELLNDIEKNLEKISHHGKRADAIVRGMLQHSRTSSGQKELTDINVLCDEYLRLAYHGLRAKDKSFSATLETNFDNSIGKINIVPQEIGRVILNLINNAFYAVNERWKGDDEGSMAAVSVSTKKPGAKISISVKDNGNGIPHQIVDKIFQPFFTTKPTGEGTGLGLSLAYDIVKAHGGEIKVETKEEEGSEFIIYLPIET